MAKVILKNAEKFICQSCPNVPYYRVNFDIIGKVASLEGNATVNYEHGQWNLRWYTPSIVDDLDINWNNSITDSVIDWTENNIKEGL